MITITKQCTVGMIAAVDRNNLIGYDNTIPWRKPVDFKRFKQLTSGAAVIVGTTTWAGIPKLPNRYVVQVSRNPEPVNPIETTLMEGRCSGYHRTTSVEDALLHVTELGHTTAWIIGGSQIYQLGFKWADFIDLTVVDLMADVPDASKAVYFPEIPETFRLESTTINPEDPTLSHLRYIKTDEKEIQTQP